MKGIKMHNRKILLVGMIGLINVATMMSAMAWGLLKAEIKDSNLPRVLFIGDSILGGYGPVVAKLLEGKANFDIYGHPYTQANNELRNELKEVLAQNNYAVIHFNMGLHSFQNGRVLISDSDFEPLMRKFVDFLRENAPNAKLVWASTTPVTIKDNVEKLDPESNAIVARHNAMAAKIMNDYKIPIDDLNQLMISRTNLMCGDTLHWKAEGYKVMGEAVAKIIGEQLK